RTTAELAAELSQVRGFLLARPAPGSPEVDEHRLALIARERERCTIERRPGDRGGVVRLEARRRHRDVLRVDRRDVILLGQPVGENAAQGDQRDEPRDQPPAHTRTLPLPRNSSASYAPA